MIDSRNFVNLRIINNTIGQFNPEIDDAFIKFIH